MAKQRTHRNAYCTNKCGRRLKPSARRYCSHECQSAYYRQRVVAAWREGRLPPRKFFNRVIRRYLISKYGERCQRCGWNERNVYTGRVPIEIEHVDGDWRNESEQNLTLLCPNCHSLSPTFRALNKGRGRPGRPGLRSQAGSESTGPVSEWFRLVLRDESQPPLLDL